MPAKKIPAFKPLENMQIVYRDVNELIHAEYNPREITEADFTQLQTSHNKFGCVEPAVINMYPGREGVIVGGNMRIECVKVLGWPTYPCIYVKLPYKEERELNIRLNRNQGRWDWDILANEFNPKTELKPWGFTEKEMDWYDFGSKLTKGLTPDDAIPAGKVPAVKMGELWQLGGHRLLCGDATQKMYRAKLMGADTAGMIFTDIPYGIDYSGGRTQVVATKTYGKIKGDKNKNISNFVKLIIDSNYSGDAYICVSPVNLNPVFDIIKKYNAVIVWKKNQPGLGYQWIRRYCEFIIFISKRKKAKNDKSEFDYWEIITDIKTEYVHGTQKPVALPERAINFSSVTGDVVVDLFGGSGSTLIACEKTNRKCRMMEIDKHYCGVIIKRWQEFTGEKAVKIK